ncbi:MAG: tryptophan--tRNA ligase, partial [Caulobacteraceae bacterium]
LAWILNCVARLGWLDRMTQFKEKSGAHKERSSVGLYDYPVLQAADILLYKATHVPVGDDQKQHLEITRDIAAKFNHDFEAPDFFPLPEPMIETTAGARVMSLRDGATKMSKSDASDLSRINLSDSDEVIRTKIRKARTDTPPLPRAVAGLAGRPEAENLVGIFAALSGTSPGAVLERFAGQGFGQGFKDELAERLVMTIGPVRDKISDLLSQPTRLDDVLTDGAERARALAEPILEEVRSIVGFLPRKTAAR